MTHNKKNNNLGNSNFFFFSWTVQVFHKKIFKSGRIKFQLQPQIIYLHYNSDNYQKNIMFYFY